MFMVSFLSKAGGWNAYIFFCLEFDLSWWPQDLLQCNPKWWSGSFNGKWHIDISAKDCISSSVNQRILKKNQKKNLIGAYIPIYKVNESHEPKRWRNYEISCIVTGLGGRLLMTEATRLSGSFNFHCIQWQTYRFKSSLKKKTNLP